MADAFLVNNLPSAIKTHGDQSIDTTGTAFAFEPLAQGVQLRVSHATQTIRVGMGTSAAAAIANAADEIPVDSSDGIVPIGRRNDTISYFALVGSGLATTCNVRQV